MVRAPKALLPLASQHLYSPLTRAHARVARRYYGYNNTSKPPSSQPFAIANRFGFRGAQALIKQTSERARHIDVEHPGNIDVEKDLGRPDEWGPTLRMEPSRSGSNLQVRGRARR